MEEQIRSLIIFPGSDPRKKYLHEKYLDTPVDFTLFGQIVILVLIQFGGLGIMTVSIAMLLFLGGGISVKWKMIFESIYNEVGTIPVRSVLKRIVLYTMTIELIAASLLFMRFLKYYPWPEALWYAVFHSVSAFCNAGFSTHTDSLLRYSSDPFVLLTVSSAIIAGGIKVTTLAAVAGLLISRIMGREQITFFGRALDRETVDKSSTMIILAGLFILISSFFLLASGLFEDRGDFLSVFFETTSAFNTVGLSTGSTAKLNDAGKLIITFVMFTGRLGPFLFITALTLNKKTSPLAYADEHIMIG